MGLNEMSAKVKQSWGGVQDKHREHIEPRGPRRKSSRYAKSKTFEHKMHKRSQNAQKITSIGDKQPPQNPVCASCAFCG